MGVFLDLLVLVFAAWGALGPQTQLIQSSKPAGVPSASTMPATLVVRVEGTTATQALLRYTAPDANPCTLEVREGSSGAPLAHDEDPRLFPGSQSDGGGAANRFWVVGKKRTDLAADGRYYSRALQTNTRHRYLLTCGNQKTEGSFKTANIPLGKTFSEPLQLDREHPGRNVFPTIDPDDRAQSIVDPNTGARIKRVTLPKDSDGLSWYDAGSFDACAPHLVNGGYHCIVPQHAVYWISPTTGEARFLGDLRVPETKDWWWVPVGVASALWDQRDSNVYYILGNTKPPGQNGKMLVLKGTYVGKDKAVKPNWKSSTFNTTDAAFEWRSLTPTRRTLTDQFVEFSPEFDPTKFSCGSYAIQSSYLILMCRRYNQDSYGWVAMFDVDSATVVAMAKTWANANSRWCGLHAIAPLGNAPVVNLTQQVLFGGGATGPYFSNLTVGISATDTTITVSGEPNSTNTNGDAHLLDAAAGDIFLVQDSARGNEYVQIVQKRSSASWVVKRGSNGTAPKSHEAGAQLWAYCSTPGGSWDYWWLFQSDPHGIDATGTNYFPELQFRGAHRVTRERYDIMADYVVRAGSLPDSLRKPATFLIDVSPPFAGAVAGAWGNSFQKHPSYGQPDAPPDEQEWFLDVLPFIGGSPGKAAPVSKQLYKYFLPEGHVLAIDQLRHFALAGTTPMTDISGPASALSDTDQDSYKYCIAKVAGECRSGSAVSDIYVNVPQLVTFSCAGSASSIPTNASDVRVLDFPTYGQALVQFGLRSANRVKSQNGLPVYGAGASRVITNTLTGYRQGSVFANARALPDGSWALFAGSSNSLQVFIAKLPPTPRPDEYDRSNFLNVAITVPAYPGAATAQLDYGYEEDGLRNNFYCTQRPEVCSVSAVPGAKVSLRGIPQRILFYRIRYLDPADNLRHVTAINSALIDPCPSNTCLLGAE
jgi:hypothetical protein